VLRAQERLELSVISGEAKFGIDSARGYCYDRFGLNVPKW